MRPITEAHADGYDQLVGWLAIQITKLHEEISDRLTYPAAPPRERGFRPGSCALFLSEQHRTRSKIMYRIYNRESGWLIFQEKQPRRAHLAGFSASTADFGNLTVSANGDARIRC